MDKLLVFSFILTFSLASQASWYWPFGSDDKAEPRLSELMEEASLMIDEASDLAAEGKVSESVAKYRKALEELDRIEEENPDRVEKPEFASLKTKRAYISAAIDSLLLAQARDYAKAVAVSDTTELEKRLAAERSGRDPAAVEEDDRQPKTDARKPEELPEVLAVTNEVARVEKVQKRAKKPASKRAKAPRALTKRDAAMRAIAEKDFETADRLIAELLKEKPNSASALNLRAARESAEGRYKDAEHTLDQAIQSNPRDYNAYYNMAVLFLQTNPENTSGARRYYETGRSYGGPADDELEALLK